MFWHIGKIYLIMSGVHIKNKGHIDFFFFFASQDPHGLMGKTREVKASTSVQFIDK